MQNNHKKETIRNEIKERRSSIIPQNKADFDNTIIHKLLETPAWHSAQKVLLYVSLPDEVNTVQLIKKCIRKKQIIVPKSHRETQTLSLHVIHSFEELEQGEYGILEPTTHSEHCAPTDIDLAIIPGVAFDLTGHRIGYGMGYYDQLNRQLTCPKIGLAYSVQSVDNIPAEEHDQQVDMLITEESIYHFNNT